MPRTQRVRLVDTASTPVPQSFNALCEELAARSSEPPAAVARTLPWRCPWLVTECTSLETHSQHPGAAGLLRASRRDEFVVSMIAVKWSGETEVLELLVEESSLTAWELRSIVSEIWAGGYGLDAQTRERKRDEQLQILLKREHLPTEIMRTLAQKPLSAEATLALLEHRSCNDLLEMELVVAAGSGPEGAGRREAIEAVGSLDARIGLALTRIRGEELSDAKALRKRARQLRALSPTKALAGAYVQLLLGLASEWEGDALSLAHTARGCLV